jgi:TRAP-type transport system small permease protein
LDRARSKKEYISSLLSKTIGILNKIVDPLSSWLGWIAGITVTAMMFLTFIDIAGSMIGKWPLISSYTDFFKPIVGGYEITAFMMLILVTSALVYCQKQKGHIRVDLILQQLPKRIKIWFDIIAYSVCIFYCIFIVWQGFIYGIDNISYHNVSAVLFIPLAPFNFILSLGVFSLILVLLRNLLDSIEEAIN